MGQELPEFLEQQLRRDLLRLALLRLGDIAPYGLDHVREQETKGCLEHRGLRGTANEMTQVEHFRDALEQLFDSPATPIRLQ